jgi:chemotaxis protein MotB
MAYRDDDSRAPRKVRWKLGMWAFLATVAAGAGGYYTWMGRACITGSAAVCEKERDALNVRAGAAEATVSKMKGNLSASQQELEELRKWKDDAAKRMQTFRDMSKKLQKMVDAGKLGVRVRDGRLVMRLPQDVLFPSGSATLSREGELSIMEVAVILRQFPDRRFMVAGHTDNQAVKEATYKDNWELSMARALVVARFMIEAKMKPENMVAAGYGEFDPIAKNATPEGRRENRRIEIILLPDLSELPMLPEDMAQAAQPKPDKQAAQPKPDK